MDNPEALESFEKNKHITVKTLPKIALSADLSPKILRYLAQITIFESGIDEQGLNFVLSVSENLKIEHDKMAEIISTTKILASKLNNY
jgi:hypothetical protein